MQICRMTTSYLTLKELCEVLLQSSARTVDAYAAESLIARIISFILYSMSSGVYLLVTVVEGTENWVMLSFS